MAPSPETRLLIIEALERIDAMLRGMPARMRLVLDTASAVGVAFTFDERRLHLIKGEILVTTARDPSSRPRPFVVTRTTT